MKARNATRYDEVNACNTNSAVSHIETILLISIADEWTGFCKIATPGLRLDALMKIVVNQCQFVFHGTYSQKKEVLFEMF